MSNALGDLADLFMTEILRVVPAHTVLDEDVLNVIVDPRAERFSRLTIEAGVELVLWQIAVGALDRLATLSTSRLAHVRVIEPT